MDPKLFRRQKLDAFGREYYLVARFFNEACSTAPQTYRQISFPAASYVEPDVIPTVPLQLNRTSSLCPSFTFVAVIMDWYSGLRPIEAA
jgi:hypothetical protein